MERNTKNKIFFLVLLILVMVAYIAFLNIFDIKAITHYSAGEEEYYLNELPKLIKGEETQLMWPGYRIGISAISLAADLFNLPRFEFIVGLNLVIFFLFSFFLYWLFIPKLFKNIKPIVNFLICLLVLTNPVLIKWVFSIHPDFIVMILLILMCYLIMIDNKFKFLYLIAITLLIMVFKEIILFIVPFLILYYFEEHKLNKKFFVYSAITIILLLLSYFFIYDYLYQSKYNLVTNKEILSDAPIKTKINNFAINFNKMDKTYFFSFMAYKIFMVYGLLWWFILKDFVKIIKKTRGRVAQLLNLLYFCTPFLLFLLASMSTGIAEKFFFQFSIIPYFYLFCMKNKIKYKVIEKRKLSYIILINIINILFYYYMIALNMG